MKKAIAIIICIMLVLSVSLPAAAISNTITKSNVDTTKRVNLQFYMLGSPPRDLSIINTKINELAKKDLNCTVKFNFTTWSDTSTKYNLLLSSGQNCDLLFTADWMNYNQYALRGAFKPLDDIVPKAAPELWSFVSKDFWNAVSVNGKIYTIPATWKEYTPGGFQYREDLRLKYNCPEIKDLTTLEAYLTAIKKNEPTMAPTECLVHDWGMGGSVFDAWLQVFNWQNNSDIMVAYGLKNDYKAPKTLTPYWGSAAFTADMKLLKKWADLGFWSRSSLSTKEYPIQGFENGKVAAVIDNNPGKYATSLATIANNHPDWKVGYVPNPMVTGYVVPVHPVHNGFAVPVSSKNAERAVAFYSKMVLDKTYNYLTEYGIEGKNFKVTSDGYYQMIGTANTNGFAREAMQGWAWRNPNIQIFDKSFDTVKALFKKFDAIAAPNVAGGFVENYTPYQSERTAMLSVQTQYYGPLSAGLVDDVDASIKIFMEKTKAAGLEKIQAEFTKQWSAYCDSHGYK